MGKQPSPAYGYFGFKLKILKSLSGNDTILEENWRQFTQYSRRIRSLGFQYHSDRSDPIDSSVYTWLSGRLRRVAPMLPSLQKIVWVAANFPPTALMLCLSSHSLRTVEITSVEAGVGDRTSMHSLVEGAPNLQTFRICGPVIPACICLLASCTALNDVHITDEDSIDQAAFDVLSSLPGLLILEVVLPDSYFLATTGFPTLETLDITANLHTVADFIANIRSSNLTKVTILSSQLDDVMNLQQLQEATALWRRCLEVLGANKYIQHSVRYIDMLSLESCTVERHVNVHAMLALQPVLVLQQIEHFHFEGQVIHRMYLNDEDVYAMASAWPNIRVLGLPIISAHTTRPTFASLYSLSLRCRQLTSLTISIDLHDLGSPADRSFLSHGLKELILINPSYKDTSDIAQFLDYLFPKLCSYQEIGATKPSAAAEVQRMLKKFQEVREVERKRHGILS
jgi:hypothetical protein